MEEGTKGRKWRVTYTKHLKQKRKVYHDGFLELSASGDKVRLYDESENLIESKFLSKAESVECSKSFTMGSHLVDIADPIHLASNPTVTSLAQQNESKCTGSKRNCSNRKPLHKVSNMMLSNNEEAAKKAEPCSTGASSTNSTLPQSLVDEWSVLYTTQLTQKAKKYHDGTLRLSQLGSHAKQVRLYDENERLLESKVLGKEDMLEPGQTLIMQAHLVNIGLFTIQVGKENSSVSSLRKPFQKPASTICSVVDTRKEAAFVEAGTPETNSILKEWNVLYTTQLNKKAKTYHDGILRLAQATGSITKQITLASEDGQVLASRHLKSFECIESGAECELTGYLVQVDGLCLCQEGYGGSNQRSPLKQFVKSKTLMKSIPTNAVDGIKKEQVKSMSPPTGNRMEMEKTANSKKCISVARRDACQIMSVLKKPPTVLEREAAQATKEAHPSLHLIQIDDSKGDDKLPSAEGMHDKYQESGIQASEVQIMVKENCSSSRMYNSSSVLSDTTVSALHEDRCEAVILDVKKTDRITGSVEASFADTDNFDFPSFDLGF